MNKRILKYFGVFAIVAIALTGLGYNRLPHVGLSAAIAHEGGSKIVIEPNLSISLSMPNMDMNNGDTMDRWMDAMQNLDDNAWLVMHEHMADGTEGQILGYVGLHNNGEPTVFKLEKNSLMDNHVDLMLHYDRGQARVFEPATTDTAVMLDGLPMMVEVEVNAYPEFFLDDSRTPMNMNNMPSTNDRQMLPHDNLDVDNRMMVY